MKLGWTPAHQIVFAIGLAAISLFAGLYFANKEASPSYAVDENYLFAEIKEEVPELKVLWNGQPIQNFYSSRVAIWNAGNDFIDSRQLYSKDPIRIIIPPSINLLSQKIDRKSRMDLAVSTLTTELNGQTIIQVNLGEGEALEVGDGFSIKLYFTSDSPTDFEVKGRIKGLPDGFSFEDWDQFFRVKTVGINDWVSFSILFAGLFVGMLHIRECRRSLKLFKQEHEQKKHKESIIAISSGLVFMSITAIVIIIFKIYTSVSVIDWIR